MLLKFPNGFLWGSATSAYQIEGGIDNCDWSRVYPAAAACDHYNRYEEDLDILQKLNQNAYRFSIEWSRIEPRDGYFDGKEMEHYKKVLTDLKRRGIKTVVTLHHFTLPLWFFEIGGWQNAKAVFYFSRFAQKLFIAYSDLVDLWITINEPMVYAAKSYITGLWPPKKKNLILFLKVLRNQVVAHKCIYDNFHKFAGKNVKVGIAKNNIFFEPFNKNSVMDRFITAASVYFWNSYFLNNIKKHMDFIGLNYYFHYCIGFPLRTINKDSVISDIGWGVNPQGMHRVLMELKKYSLPIYITENGIADGKDILRQEFIKNNLYWTHKALQDGVDVRGYLHWSLIDNFEWDLGFNPRFGLIEINYKTFERKIRPSAYYYSQVCKNNQLVFD